MAHTYCKTARISMRNGFNAQRHMLICKTIATQNVEAHMSIVLYLYMYSFLFINSPSLAMCNLAPCLLNQIYVWIHIDLQRKMLANVCADICIFTFIYVSTSLHSRSDTLPTVSNICMHKYKPAVQNVRTWIVAFYADICTDTLIYVQAPLD